MSILSIHKIILLYTLILGLVTTTSLFHDYTFEQYMHQFNKTYTEEEQKWRRELFNERKAQIIEIQERDSTTINPNEFMDSTEEERSNMFGLKIDSFSKIKYSEFKVRAKLSSIVLPQTFDYRNYGKITPVRSQGFCGSCWAFAATAKFQSLLLMMNKPEYDLAEQYLVQCDTANNRCKGGFPDKAFDFLSRFGLPLEQQFPYQGNKTIPGICQANPSGFIKFGANLTQNSWITDLTTDQLKQILVEKGPQVVGIHSYFTGFALTPSTGIVTCPMYNILPDHAVLLVGYTENHWIIKNSHGENWGNRGYGYIPMSNDCLLLKNVFFIDTDFSGDEDEESSEQITLSIEMTDSYGDGWNQNIFAFVQNNNYVADFGKNFVSGSSKNTSATILKNRETKITVYQNGNWGAECGFTVRRTDGSILFSRASGSSFKSAQVFYTFCEGICQQVSQNKTYSITLQDSFGDGWNGNSIIVMQEDKGLELGIDFNQGSRKGPISFTVQIGKLVTIKPGFIGSWRQEVGFKIQSLDGRETYAWPPGNYYSGNSILLEFNPGNLNTLPVSIAPIQITKQTNQVESDEDYLIQPEQDSIEREEVKEEDLEKTLMIITLVSLSIIVLLLVGFLLFISVKMVVSQGKSHNEGSLGTGSNLQIPYDGRDVNSGI